FTAGSALILTSAGYGDSVGPFDTTTGTNNVGASFFYLLRTQDLTPEVFICPSSNGVRRLSSRATTRQTSSNFPGLAASGTQDCTFTYMNPFPSTTATGLGFKFNNTLSADFAIAADINPGSVATVPTGSTVGVIVYNSARSATIGSNTRNHKGDG